MDEVGVELVSVTKPTKKRLRVAAYRKKIKKQKKLGGSKNRLRAKNEELVKVVYEFCQEREKWRSKTETLIK